MDRRSVSPARPRNLSLQDTDPPSATPSPASECENKKWSDDIEEYDEISEYIKEVDEILDFLKPFPRNQEQTTNIEPPKPGFDHLENLIRLVDHLKDLKERNAQSRQKTQYLKDLKTLRDQKRRLTVREDDFLPPLVEFTRKPRASIPFRKSNRSKSLSSDDNERFHSNERFFPPRASLAPIKAKVSKWTKVKEAFRWEKAAQLDTRQKHVKTDKKSEQCRVQELPLQDVLSTSHLQVPGDKYGDSPSPADSVLSGQISSGTSTSCLLASSGYSGEHSSAAHSSSSVHLLDLPTPPPRPLFEDDSLSLSSSDDEKVEDNATITEEAVESMNFSLTDDPESRRSKSLDSGSLLASSSHFLQHLSKESLHECSKSQRSHKTPWGKVKDIIHTKRGSLKKKVKKREDFKAEAEAFSAALDLPLAEDGHKEMAPIVEITPSERTPENPTPILPLRLESSIMRPFTPVLTLTLPSSEELQKISSIEIQDGKVVWLASPEDDACRVSDPQLFDDKGKTQGRSSRWGKVKRAFLTSGNEEQLSAPSSPLQLGSFFSDIESDELSSGEWMDHEKRLEIQGLTAALKAEVHRNFSELQHKLCQELDANVADCEMLKTPPIKSDAKLKIEDSDRISKKPRESLTIPLPSVDDLSPDFKKKLDEWKKIKKSPTTPSASTKEEVQSHFMTRIGEWQRWRPGSHKLEVSAKQEHHLQEEFYKKLEEWQMLKGTKRRSRSHSDRGKEDNENQTPSPGLSRKNSKGAVKKLASRGNSSGTDSLSGSLKEKEGRAGRKTQREKDLQWLEKELHKIEREKQRLEREREKYLEREARLEQMKRTMGSTSPTQEVLIQTATGFFRFEGISQKFTKKLYEWEKARGIAPEASTIALLETANIARKGPVREERVGLQRSKSVGSVIDSGSMMAQSIAQHPSSLSLNDVDDLEAMEQAVLMDTSRASSEPGMDFKEEDEPEALIVDVEDEVIETAAPMNEPHIQTHVPVYSYAPIEVTQLIDSSESDGERDLHVTEVSTLVRKKSEEKANLIDQNFDLLEQLAVKEAICREIETDLETIQGQITEESDDKSSPPKEHLLREGENLEHSFIEHSEQQEELAHDLVDNMFLLHAAHVSSSEPAASNVSQVLDLSSQLLSLAQKLEEALNKRNAEVKTHRSSSKRHRMKVNRMGSGKKWYSIDETTRPDCDSFFPKDVWTSPEPDYEVEELPSLITKKVIELKKGLCNLRKVSEIHNEEKVVDEKRPTSEENSATFTVRVVDKGARSSITSIEEEQSQSRKEKRPSLRIPENPSTTPPENLSPVTVTVSPTFWMKAAPTNRNSQERRLGKSKAQELCSDNAEEVFISNVKTVDPVFDKKNQDVIKKKIKDKISEMQRLASENRTRGIRQAENDSTEEAFHDVNEDENVVVVVKRDGFEPRQKRTLKTRRITDTTIAYGFTEKTTPPADDNDDVFLKNNEEDESDEKVSSPSLLASSTPAFVFVPTRRKIISPVQRDVSSSVISYVIDEIESKEVNKADSGMEGKIEEATLTEAGICTSEKSEMAQEIQERKKSIGRQGGDIGIPPLPNSPSLARKLTPKDSSPSIRLMIAKYNQKISEQESSPISAGSASPVGWRSPILERRIKEQLDRFQQDGSNALRHGGKFERREVQKSASAGIIQTKDINKTAFSDSKPELSGEEISLRGILKSSSTGTMKSSCSNENSTVGSKEKICLPPAYVPETPETDSYEINGSLALRALKLKQAKAEFLSRGSSGQSWTGELSHTPTPSTSSAPFSWGISGVSSVVSDPFNRRNRLSHVSVGSESSHDEASCGDEYPGLTKSVSAGMINLDRSDILRRKSESNVEQVCVQKIVGHSTPESTNPPKVSSRFGISNIKSRFRKVKMRRAKEKESAVSTLCRQSLLLDISQPLEGARAQASTSKSCPSSPVLDRSRHKGDDSKSWVKNPTRLFKGKDSKSTADATLQKRV